MNDHEILGVDEDATEEEITKRYKQQAMILHPDRNDGDEEQFKKVKSAYERLMNGDMGIDNLYANAQQSLYDCFKQLMSQVDPLKDDMVDVARNSINKQIFDQTPIKHKIKQAIEENEKLQWRMTTKSEINVFEEILKDNIKKLKSQEKGIDKSIELWHKMLEILDDLEYRTDPAQEPYATIQMGEAAIIRYF